MTFLDCCARVEVVRSFSYKYNAGNYESRDFFCSQKADCLAADAERISELLHEFCKNQVLKALAQFKQEHDRRTN